MEENIDITAELEQLRSDYAVLKKRLDDQEIINDGLLIDSIHSKVRVIDGHDRINIACAILALFFSPAYHYIFNASWWFCGATAVFMAYGCFCTIRRHKDLFLAYKVGKDMLPIVKKIRYFRNEYVNWLNVGLPLTAAWALWLFVEIFLHAENRPAAIFLSGCVAAGLSVAGAIGMRMRARVIRSCDAVISQLKK
ncbi:MAG: hypothetical protein MJY58_07785 [Bacteroidaceae bacterium]|nr:hypothetical protein [Bacteroidaceae bacterium]